MFVIVFIVGLVCDTVKFVLESLEKDGPSNPLPGEARGNVFNRNLFWWLNPLLLQGFREVLAVDKLIAIDHRVNNETDTDKFARKWDAGMPTQPTYPPPQAMNTQASYSLTTSQSRISPQHR